MVNTSTLHAAWACIVIMVYTTTCSGQNNAHGKPPTVRGQLRDRANAHDYDHIVEHLDGMVEPEDKYSDEEMQFHYFKAHDYDDNNKLDGIELISALTHYHKDEDPNGVEPRMTDYELQDMVDAILQDEDGNDDGYIDYVEFLRSQGREATVINRDMDPVQENFGAAGGTLS